ncbi:MAG: hypothetical protein IJT50_13185 [Lentisphaeria bacterium]|nr:hypothetical protein [Lentisphaeria bacterium]
MILSDGNNKFKDDTFDFWTWSAPIFQTAEEVTAFVHEQKLIGRIIKDIQTVGYGYDFLRGDCFIDIFEAICKKDHKSLDSMDFPCAIEIDEPLLILFEDGDILGIDFSDASSIRLEMNTLPWRIRPCINPKNFHADRLFKDILGSRISNIIISSSIKPSDTALTDLDEQPSYLDSFSFICHGEGSKAADQLELNFEADFDYGYVSLERESVPVRLPAARLPDILEGYLSLEDMKDYLKSF